MERQRDSQRQKVYDSERVVADYTIQPTAARRKVREICRVFDMEPPRVVIRKGGVRSRFKAGPDPQLCMLPQDDDRGVSTRDLLHELAHFMVWRREFPIDGPYQCRPYPAWHGPEFCRHIIALYTLAGLDPHGLLVEQFRKRNVRF